MEKSELIFQALDINSVLLYRRKTCGTAILQFHQYVQVVTYIKCFYSVVQLLIGCWRGTTCGLGTKEALYGLWNMLIFQHGVGSSGIFRELFILLYLTTVQRRKLTMHHLGCMTFLFLRHQYACRFHETGCYDLPAFIDLILRKTRHKKLAYSGLSDSGAIYYVLTTMRPEYQEKLYGGILWSPVGQSPPLSSMPFWTQTAVRIAYWILVSFCIYALGPSTEETIGGKTIYLSYLIHAYIIWVFGFPAYLLGPRTMALLFRIFHRRFAPKESILQEKCI